MAFFDDLKKGLSSTGKQVAERTKEISESVRLKAQITAEKEAVKREYRKIGEQVYRNASPEDAARYPESFSAIRESQEKIAQLEASLSEIDGSVNCPVCGAKVEKSASFCGKCGAKVERVRDASGEEKGACVEEEEAGKAEAADAVQKAEPVVVEEEAETAPKTETVCAAGDGEESKASESTAAPETENGADA